MENNHIIKSGAEGYWPEDVPANLLTPARWQCQPDKGNDRAPAEHSTA